MSRAAVVLMVMREVQPVQATSIESTVQRLVCYRANKAQSLNKRIIFPSQCDLSKDPSKRASRPEIARVSASCPRNPKKNPHYTSAHVIREIPRKFARISVSFPSVCRVLRTWNDLSTEATLLNNTASLRPIQFFYKQRQTGSLALPFG